MKPETLSLIAKSAFSMRPRKAEKAREKIVLDGLAALEKWAYELDRKLVEAGGCGMPEGELQALARELAKASRDE